MDGYDPVNLSSPIGLTAGLVLFGDTDGSIAQDTGFTYNSTTDVLDVGRIRTGDGTAASPSHSFTSDTTTGWYLGSTFIMTASAGGGDRLSIVDASLRLRSSTLFGWASGASSSTSLDTIMARDAANTINQRNGATAQTLRVSSTFTDTSNYEVLAIFGQAAASFIIDSQAAGTGTVRDLTLRRGGSNRFVLGATAINWDNVGLASASNQRFSHGTSALATTATEGFLHLQSCAGHPTGTPASIPSGQKPLVWNSTDKALELYDSAWREITELAVEATADQTATSDATVNDDSALVVNVRASGVYEFEIFLFINNAGAAGGFRCTIAGTATATSIKAQAHFAGEGLGHATDMQRFAALGTEVSSVSGAPSGNSHVRIVGTIEVNAAGTFLFRWSQAVSSASTTTRQRNSYMKLTRVG